jgi:hypothetical protein
MEGTNDLPISKDKLPRKSSYVLQTSDIIETLDTSDLRLSYAHLQNKDGSRAWGRIDILFCDYRQTEARRFFLGISSVPSQVRHQLRKAVKIEVLPLLKQWMSVQGIRNNSFFVHYERHHPSNYELYDRGGIYIEQNGKRRDRFGRVERAGIRRIHAFVLTQQDEGGDSVPADAQ